MGTSSSATSISRHDRFRDSQSAVSRRRRTSSSKEFEDQNPTSHDSMNIQDLSFILHPAHEPSMSEKNTSPNSMSDGFEHGKSTGIACASHTLGVPPDTLEKM